MRIDVFVWRGFICSDPLIMSAYVPSHVILAKFRTSGFRRLLLNSETGLAGSANPPSSATSGHGKASCPRVMLFELNPFELHNLSILLRLVVSRSASYARESPESHTVTSMNYEYVFDIRHLARVTFQSTAVSNYMPTKKNCCNRCSTHTRDDPWVRDAQGAQISYRRVWDRLYIGLLRCKAPLQLQKSSLKSFGYGLCVPGRVGNCWWLPSFSGHISEHTRQS